MSTNTDLARIFSDMATALELTGANPFRVNAHAKVARILADLTEDVRDIVEEEPEAAGKRLTAIDGIGKGSAQKILEFVVSGNIAEHQELLAAVPKGLFDVLNIPGLGPKTVKLMWDQLGITSMDALKGQLDSPELAALPRMGKKTISNIRKAIEFAEKSAGRIPLGMAHPIAVSLVESIGALPGVVQVKYAGSLRRGKETIGDIDVLVACKDDETVREFFCTMPEVTQVLARGETKCSVRLEVEGVALQADLRIIPEAHFGAGLLYFSGSKEHNVILRELAIKKDMRLNEYGLYPGTDERPQDSGTKPVAAKTEESIFKALGLPFVPPELREEWRSIDETPPTLISVDDIRSDLHTHTVASDGRMSIDELVMEAKERGYHTIAVTDHSKSSVIANGLDETRLRKHIEKVREANERIKGITVLAGSEVDILNDGRLDYDDKLLAELDIVVASPHVGLRQSPEEATRRLLRAIKHPLVHIIGHPTGRIVNGREGMRPDMNALFEAAAECNTALEINANWKRLDLRDTHVRAALAAGCLIAIDTDAHRPHHFDFLQYGVLTGRRAGLTAESCINTWAAEKLHEWLRAKR